MKQLKSLSLIITIIVITNYSAMAQIEINKEYTSESGLKYVFTKLGTGTKAESGDKVAVHYTGKLTNDSVFDSSYKRNQQFEFYLGAGQVIIGWDEGIALMKVVDKATLTIPSELGYGEADMGVIPPNSILVFDVELVNVTKITKPKEFDVKGKDTTTTQTGLKCIIIHETDGVQAKAGDMVTVHYTGYFLDGKIFDSSVQRGTPFGFQLGQGKVIKGWDEGIALLKVGEKARLIIPYTLAYGEKEIGPIPAKSTLIFDVELIDAK